VRRKQRRTDRLAYPHDGETGYRKFSCPRPENYL